MALHRLMEVIPVRLAVSSKPQQQLDDYHRCRFYTAMVRTSLPDLHLASYLSLMHSFDISRGTDDPRG
jgi:hypothetical protein